jgi:hypothetical protein
MKYLKNIYIFAILFLFLFNLNAHALEKVPREKTLVVTPWSDTTGPLKNAKDWHIYIKFATKIKER